VKRKSEKGAGLLSLSARGDPDVELLFDMVSMDRAKRWAGVNVYYRSGCVL
jgi:hypothetical protein